MKKNRGVFILVLIVSMGLISGCAQVKRNVPKNINAKIKQKAYSTVQPVVELDNRYILNKENSRVFLLVSFDIPKIKKEKEAKRPNVNISVVLDRSGSMKDIGKMTYAIEAAKYIVDNLQDTDKLAVVEYDDKISVLWPSGPLTFRDMIKKRIDELTPRGSTNLTGGLVKGIFEIKESYKYEQINRVLLLSDGLANVGIVKPSAIKEIVKNTRDEGITVSTVGLGLHYNEDLMQMIAETGKGGYYYVENPSQISRIFHEELSRIFTTVAKDVQILFKGSGIVKKISVYGYTHKIEGSGAKIQMGNLFEEEKRSLLIRLDVFTGKKGKNELGDLEVSLYDNLKKHKQKQIYSLGIISTEDKEKVKEYQNQKILAEATLIEADSYHEQYVKQFEKGKKALAKQNINKLTKQLKETNKDLNDVRLAKKIEGLMMESTEMEKAEQDTASRQSYLKKSKQAFYLAQKGKRSKYLLQKGSRGYDVERLQKKLKELKYYNGPIDGIYSGKVVEAVEKFQKKVGIKPDGIAGPKTLKMLGLY